MDNCNPTKINVYLDFASVDIGFLGVTISIVTFSCSQHLHIIECLSANHNQLFNMKVYND